MGAHLAGALDLVTPCAVLPATVTGIQGSYDFATSYEIFASGKRLFGSRSPAFTLVAWRWLHYAQGMIGSKMARLGPLRFLGYTEIDISRVAQKMDADLATALSTPHKLLDLISVQSNWDGTGVEYRVIAGDEDQWKFVIQNWREALIIGRECEDSGVPVEITAQYRGQQAVFFKFGQTLVERIVARRKLEAANKDTEKAEEAMRVVHVEASNAHARVKGLTAKAHQRTGFAVDLVR